MRNVIAVGLLMLAALCNAARAENIHLEQNGLLVVEIEAAPVSASWSVQTTVAGFSGTNYYEWKTGNDSPKADKAGQGILRYRFRIATPGRYRFQLRSAAPHKTEHNDVWFRFPASGALRMKKDVFTPIAGSEWTKLYQNAGNNAWTWNSSTVDHDAHGLYVDLKEAGEYDLEFSGRSTQFKMDRFVLYHSSVSTANATKTSNPPSPAVAAGAATGKQNK